MKCLKGFLYDLKVRLVPPHKWNDINHAFDSTTTHLKDSELWWVLNEESCAALVLKEKKYIAEICAECQDTILNRMPEYQCFFEEFDF